MLKPNKFLLLLLLYLLFSSRSEAAAEELIAYSHLTDGYWQIWVMDSRGGNKRQITTSQQDKRDPAWIKKGERMVFRTNNGGLFLVDLDSGNEQEILKKYKAINNPHFSEVTKEVIFVRFDPKSMDISDIWKSDLEGKKAVLLTKDNRLKYQPNFSPEGDKIVFVKADENTLGHQIWMMDADGGNQRQLTKEEGFNTLPSFSSNGEWITFTSNREGGDYEIFLLEIESGQIKRLTENAGLDTSSIFSSNGEKIAFVSNRNGNQQIWVMDKDGSNPVQLTFGEDESVDPAWNLVEDK